MKELWQIAQDLGIIQTAIIVLLLVAYIERKTILGWFGRRQDIVDQDRAFDRKREINGETYARDLVERILQNADAERQERTELVRILIEEIKSAAHREAQQAQATERMAANAVEVMKDFVDIARMQGERQDARDQELIPLLRENKGALEANWFQLMRNAQNPVKAELMRRAEGDTEDDRGTEQHARKA